MLIVNLNGIYRYRIYQKHRSEPDVDISDPTTTEGLHCGNGLNGQYISRLAH